jgi:hypothetical protein
MNECRKCQTKFDICYACLTKILLPELRNRGRRFKKFLQIHATPAQGGERIVSITSDGKETELTARFGDYIVMNLTEARERYVIERTKFEARYTYVRELDNGYALYDPIGEVYSLLIDFELLRTLKMEAEFSVEAPWGMAQRVTKGDFFVAPPDFSEVYRIARKEFTESYRRAYSKGSLSC